MGFGVLAATIALSISSASADEIDDILNVEGVIEGKGMTEAVDLSTPVSAVMQHSESVEKVNKGGRPDARLREMERALTAARLEINELKEYCAALEARHRRELHFAHYNMGCVYKASRKYERAESEFLKALETQPDDPAVHFNLGILYDDDLGNKKAARKHYERFLELAPGDPDAIDVREWLDALNK